MRDEYFSDSVINLGDVKLTGEQNRGKWIIEIPELNGMSERSVESVKAGITRQVDEFRGAYCRRTEAFPRRVVFVGTTNEADFIRERTSGARRFLPVLCGIERTENSVFDEDFPAAVRQAWAEARTWMKAGDPRFSTILTPEMEAEAAMQRGRFVEEDPVCRRSSHISPVIPTVPCARSRSSIRPSTLRRPRPTARWSAASSRRSAPVGFRATSVSALHTASSAVGCSGERIRADGVPQHAAAAPHLPPFTCKTLRTVPKVPWIPKLLTELRHLWHHATSRS